MSDGPLYRKWLKDGTCLLSHQTDFYFHLHVASDGTVLSIKEGQSRIYSRAYVRGSIIRILDDYEIIEEAMWRE
ncbi:MAG: hypothetical protein HQM08_30990 [Candidatus Riflebacteria bacterium]|nr:hypothetical protein [Candidatus Riflebacteria bacterium]